MVKSSHNYVIINESVFTWEKYNYKGDRMKELITQEKLQQLDECIRKNKLKPGPLMPTLQDAQRIFGCVPEEIQAHISKALHESYAKINGVVTFYAMFSTEPKGKHVIGVCTGTACYVKGAQKLLEKVCEELQTKPGDKTKDNQFTIAPTRCVGACGLAPVVMVDEDVHGKLVTSDIPGILNQYKKIVE